MSLTDFDRAQRRRSIAWGVAVVLGFLLIGAGVITVAVFDQQRRSDRISVAETKYAAEFVKRARDGEGGGTWTFSDGHTEMCQISGEVKNPTLLCGADLVEPPSAFTTRSLARPGQEPRRTPLRAARILSDT